MINLKEALRSIILEANPTISEERLQMLVGKYAKFVSEWFDLDS